MRRLAILSAFYLMVVSVTGQMPDPNTALYRDTVPLLIQTALFSTSSEHTREFVFLSGRIKVSLAHSRDFIHAGTYIEQSVKHLDSSALLHAEYRIVSPDRSVTSWRRIPMDRSILDTNLGVNTRIILQFRLPRQQKILQQTKITSADWSPGVYAYRSLPFSDTFNHKQTARVFYNETRLPAGFMFSNASSSIFLPAGRNVELAVAHYQLNRDSCIEFRIIDSSANRSGKWTQTGHLVTVKNLTARHDYTIELRYKGDSVFQSLRIVVLPYWWQTVWAITIFNVTGISMIAATVYLIRKRQNSIAAHKRALGLEKYKKEQNKLDPHWMDNMFHTLLGFIRNNQNDLADEYLGKASSILRDKLVHGERLLIPFEDDLKILKNFISNEQMKHAFDYSIDIDPELETTAMLLPPILWQPSIENAVKHGEDFFISIRVFRKQDDLVFEISNTGSFITGTATSGNGYGISITEERVKGWNMANPGSSIGFTLKQIDNEVVARFVFEKWLA